MTAEVKFILSADNTRSSAALRQTEAEVRAVEKATDAANRMAISWGGALGALAGGLASAFSVTQLIRFTSSTIDSVAALGDMATATGTTVEKLSELENIARANGGGLKDVTDLIGQLNQHLNQATGKDTTSQALKAIGLSAADLRKEDPADALREIAVALADYQDGGAKARVEQALFGEGAQRAASFLRDLAVAGHDGATVFTEQSKEAKEFQKQLYAVETTIGDAARSILSDMLPALGRLSKELSEGIKIFGSFYEAAAALGLSNPFKSYAEHAADAKKEIGQVEEAIRNVRDRAARQERNANDDQFLDLSEKKLDGLKKQLEFYTRLQGTGAPAGAPGTGGTGTKPLTFEPSSGRGAQKAYSEAPDSFLSGQAFAQAQAAKLYAGTIDEARKAVEADGQFQKQRSEQQSSFNQQAIEAARQLTTSLTDENATLSANLLTDERTRGEALIKIDRDRMQRQLDALGVTGDARSAAMSAIDDKIVLQQRTLVDRLKPEWKRMADAWKDPLAQMKKEGERFQQSFVDGGRDMFKEFLKTGRISMDSFSDLITETLTRLIYDRYLSQQMASFGDAIFGWLTGAASSYFGGGSTTGGGGTVINGDAGITTNPGQASAPRSKAASVTYNTFNFQQQIGSDVSRSEVQATVAQGNRAVVAQIQDKTLRGNRVLRGAS